MTQNGQFTKCSGAELTAGRGRHFSKLLLELFDPSSFMPRVSKARFPVLSVVGIKPRTQAALSLTVSPPLSF